MMSKSAQKIVQGAASSIGASRRGLIAGGLALALTRAFDRAALAAEQTPATRVKPAVSLIVEGVGIEGDWVEIGPFKALSEITTHHEPPGGTGSSAAIPTLIDIVLTDGPEVKGPLQHWYDAGPGDSWTGSLSVTADVDLRGDPRVAVRPMIVTITGAGGNRRWRYGFGKAVAHELVLATQGSKQVIKQLKIAAGVMTTSYGERTSSGSPWSEIPMTLEFNVKDLPFNWDISGLPEEP